MTDMTAVADVLNRAADRLEEHAAAATQGEEQHLYDDPGWSADEDPGCTEPGEVVWPVVRACDNEVVAMCERRADADLIALMDPRVVSALVPALRAQAKRLTLARGSVPLSLMPVAISLVVFARMVLREEET